MSRDIKNFNNGIDVDSVADRIAAGDNDALAQFFSDAAGAEFLVPFKGSPNNLAVLNSPEGEKMLPAFSSYEAFETIAAPVNAPIVAFMLDCMLI